MRYLAASILLLVGCSSRPVDVAPVLPQPVAPVQQTELQAVWEKEVAEDLAIYRAIRPSITGPASALDLYDSATQGLASLSGEPTAKAIDRFRGYVEKPDQNRLDALRAEKVALDKKTDELEKKVEAEKQERIRQQARADAAEQAEIRAAIQARKAESVSTMTKVGAGAVAVGVLALLFGSWMNISKLTAGLVIAAGLGIATAAPWIIDLAEMKWVILFLLAFLGTDLLIFIGVKTWRLLRREKETPPA